jgi:hypothetical protein
VAQTWTTTELLADIRAQMRLPDDDPDATDAVLLAEATRQLHTKFVPLVRKARSDYYQVYEDQDLVAGQAAYDIPHRAATSSVREVMLVDSAGRTTPLHPNTNSDRHAYTGGARGEPARYTIADDQVVLMPTPGTASSTLRIVYELRPSSLILPTACDTLESVTYTPADGADPAYYVLTFVDDNVWTVGTYLDIIRSTPPFSVAMLNCTWEQTLVFGLFIPEATSRTPRVGDYICNSGESPIPQIPAEFHPILAKATAASYLAPIDADTSQRLRQEVAQELEQAVSLLGKRQQGKQVKMRSRGGPLRRGRGGTGTFGDWS